MLKPIAAALATLSLLAAPALAQDAPASEAASEAAPGPMAGRTLVVFITTREVREAGMGLHLAAGAARAGGDVTVVLGANGAAFGLAEGAQDAFAAGGGVTPREQITHVIEAGGEVLFCQLCANWMEVADEDLVPGVRVVPGIDIFNAVFAEDARVLQF